jgi:hypothetical protein
MKTRRTPGQSKAAIKIDVKMDALRAQAKSVQFKIDNVDRVINGLGFNGNN